MSKYDFNLPHSSSDDLPTSQPIVGAHAFNIEDFQGDLQDSGLSDEQARVFLNTLWNIMGAFVELGISVDICGQIFEGFENLPADSP